ncbi:Nn.00g051960.m01.CDS01 [Neocucurbitaria sp. VM-36]
MSYLNDGFMDADWEEVERMAIAASAEDAQLASQYPTPETIERWKRLFGYSHMEAVHLISGQRGDVTRERITDDHWALIKDEKEALGYDRAAYEHSLQLPKLFKGQSASIPMAGADGEMMYLFRLGGLLKTPGKVKEVADLEELPVIREGMNEKEIVTFCVVNKDTQKKLEEWLTQQSVLQK